MRVKRDIIKRRIRDFLESEARSCSMDFGCVTPLYVYRMWGGNVPLEDVVTTLEEIKKDLRSLL